MSVFAPLFSRVSGNTPSPVPLMEFELQQPREDSALSRKQADWHRPGRVAGAQTGRTETQYRNAERLALELAGKG